MGLCFFLIKPYKWT